MKNYRQFSIQSAFLVTAVSAVVALWFQPQVVRVSMKLVDIDRKNNVAEIEIKNESPNPIWFFGYDKTSPFYNLSFQTADSDQWNRSFLGWCGTGASEIQLARNEKTRVRIHFGILHSAPQTPTRFRVAINFAANAEQSGVKEVFSEPIELVKP